MARKGKGKASTGKPAPKGGGRGTSGSASGSKPGSRLETIDRDGKRFPTPELAFAEAERVIAKAQASDAADLRIQLRSLEALPSSIAGLTGLQTLRLPSTRVADLAPLTGLAGLQTLSLDRTQVTDLTPIRSLPSLQNLSLDDSQVIDLAPLAGLTGLLTLSLSSTQITSIAPLAGLAGLRTLWLAYTHVADVAPLAGLSRLQTLWLNGTLVNDLTPIRSLTGLQNLRLTGIRLIDFAPLADLTGLLNLSLEGANITDLAPLAGLADLQSLSLVNTQVADLTPIASLAGLPNLWLDNTRVADLSPLAGLADLQALSLNGTHVTDLAPIARMTKLADTACNQLIGDFAGLELAATPAASRAPIGLFAAMANPWRTVEIINVARREQGLPEYFPKGYERNDEVRRILAEMGNVAKPLMKPDDAAPLPTLPEPRPAAIEPHWRKGRLTLPSAASRGDLDPSSLDASLHGVRRQFERLAADLTAEGPGNNDFKRAASFLDDLAKRIPETTPPQHELFALGHELETLRGYGTTVTEQWPPLLASRYHAATLAFDETVRQFPRWREFKRNAAADTLSTEQIRDAPAVARALASELRSDEVKPLVDEAIPTAMEEQAAAISPQPVPAADGAGARPPRAPIELSQDALAEWTLDTLEGVNNTLKKLFAAAINAPSVKKATGDFQKELDKDVARSGKPLYKWTKRIAAGGVLGAAGAVIGGAVGAKVALGAGAAVYTLSQLAKKYPKQFGWLKPFLDFFKQLD